MAELLKAIALRGDPQGSDGKAEFISRFSTRQDLGRVCGWRDKQVQFLFWRKCAPPPPFLCPGPRPSFCRRTRRSRRGAARVVNLLRSLCSAPRAAPQFKTNKKKPRRSTC